MKTLIYVRHGRKNGKELAADQITEIEQHGIPAVNGLLRGDAVIIHNGTELHRTFQTMEAYAQHLTGIGFNVTRLPANPLLGTQKTSDLLLALPNIMTKKDELGWYGAVASLDLALLESIQADGLAGIKQIFDAIDDEDTVVSAGHSPLIEFFAIALNESVDKMTSLDELTGFIFTQDEKGNMTVLRHIA